jgi:hypothetical protein
MAPLTHHAQARSQQRGIPGPVIETQLDYGHEEHDHHGSRIIFFDHRSRAQLRKALGDEQYRRIERHLDAYVVVALDGDVVTVGHRRHHINRH